MGLEEELGETALDLVKNENVQNKVADLFGMLFLYAGIKKKAVDMYIEEIENSDLSTEAKMISLLNAKKTLKKIKNQKNIAEIAKENAKNGVINKTRYSRLLESHFSLENVIKFLKSNDLSYAKNIVLCHLSDTNSNQDIMQNKVYEATKIKTTIARPGLNLELKLYPF